MRDFIKVIEGLIELFRQLTPLEEKKMEAAKENNVVFIEDCMVKEQAAILKLKGLENEREKIQEKLGMKGLTFREILEKFPEEAESLRPLFSELTTQIQMFQEINDGANSVIKTNLHQIESAIRLKDGGIYSETGMPAKPEQHFTNRKA